MQIVITTKLQGYTPEIIINSYLNEILKNAVSKGTRWSSIIVL